QKAHSDHLRPVPFVNPHPLTAPSQDDVHRQDGEGEAERIETHRIELPERVLHHGEIETPDHRDNREQKLNDTNFFIQWMMGEVDSDDIKALPESLNMRSQGISKAFRGAGR